MSKNNLKIVSIVPARSGSKGLPDKNIKDLGGYPLLAWSVRASSKSMYIESTYISTDSNEYAEIGVRHGAIAPYIRPGYLSSDSSTDYDFVSHFLNYLKSNESLPDLLVHLRPTTPFRDPNLIDKAIEDAIRNSEKITALRSVHEMAETAYKSFEFRSGEFLVRTFTKSEELDSANAARQTLPPTYQANGYVDVLFPNKILESKKLHGNQVLGFRTPSVIEIDTAEEFKLCQASLTIDETYHERIWS
jgi:CMP-N,N'-diacetyllegionaminic acid synthase